MMKKIYEAIILLGPLVGMFLPEYLFATIAIPSFLLIVFNIPLMKQICLYKKNYLLWIFGVYAFVLSLIYQNSLGMITAVIAMLIFIWFSYLRTVMTKEKYEFMGVIIGLGSLLSIYFTTVDYHQQISVKIVDYFASLFNLNYAYMLDETSRAQSTFFHPNFYGYIIIVVILFSLFQILNRLPKQKSKSNIALILFYVGILIANISVINLPQSRSMYFALIAGCVVMMAMISYKYFFVFVLPIICYISLEFSVILAEIPRIQSFISDFATRYEIWKTAKIAFSDNFLFGRGFYTYQQTYLYYGCEFTIHSHNLFIDILLCFGVVGTSILSIYIINILWDSVKQWIYYKKEYTPLIIALMALTIVHGYSDFILLCPQTVLVFFCMMSGMECNMNKE